MERMSSLKLREARREARREAQNIPPFFRSKFARDSGEVMTWGGLRGAVGLALALSMRNLLIQQGKEYTANLMAPRNKGSTARKVDEGG